MPPKEQRFERSLRVPVVIYARVSTDKQVGGRFDSCESQTAVCREIVRQHAAEGWYEVAALTDAAYSGGTMNRPGIQKLKRMIEAGEVKVVVIFKLERLSRNIDEWGPFRAFMEQHGCKLVSATEDISEEEPEGRLKNNIVMSVNDFDRRNIAKKTRIKMREQARRGFWNGGIVPFGYSYDKNTQTLQPHPTEAPLVRRIYEDAAKLISLTDIANQLNAEGHRTKVRVNYRRDGSEHMVGGRFFRSDGLRLILRNPLYRAAVKFEGQEFAAQHPALVSADLWDKANAATAETKPRPIYLFREQDVHHHLLKGLVWCGSCGRALIPADSGKKVKSGVKYRYYTCSLVMRESQSTSCPVRRLSADALEQAVIAVIGESSQHPTLVSEMVNVSRRLRAGDRDSLRADLERIKGELVAVDKKLTNCAEAVARDGVSALGEVLVRRAAELRQQRQGLLLDQERKRQELTAADALVLEETAIRSNLQRLRDVLPALPRDEQKKLVRLFIERVEVRRCAPRKGESVESVHDRLMAVRIKLYLPELVRSMEERSAAPKHRAEITIRGLTLDARIDFAQAQRGEVTVVAPFRQAFRLHDRIRTVPQPKPVPEHPILRAQQWQELLLSGAVATRMALAKKVRLTPSAVTRILKLIELDPGIQTYLARLKSTNAIWYFGYRPMGKLAGLPFEQQRAAFAKMRGDFEAMQQRNLARHKTVELSVATVRSPKVGRGLSAG
jgi:DNA invertase Pin-like site-specific DNA recombinase